MFYTFARFIVLLLFKIFFRLKVFGRGNFPEKGPLIVVSNHASFLDPMIAGVAAPRKLIYLARDTLFRFRPFGYILNRVNTFPLKRGKGDLAAFRLALGKLSEGQAVLVFPEGTRSSDGNLQAPKSGIGFLHSISKAAILPCYVKGSMEAWPRHSRFPRHSAVSVYFGKPLSFDKNFPGNKRESYLIIARETMKAIAELKIHADKNS
ncbi:MAG: 1-acyl-sn-glycerol-3-phosphate acyltransferase [Candidatus Omnitrophica bacterium]|nr:1-acyl-sn-glycerol-3-phosphate acyltransferase [Candidatus Omnitrophota bacterium]